jgi:hypothetical protein
VPPNAFAKLLPCCRILRLLYDAVVPSVVLPRGGTSLKFILTVSDTHIQVVGHHRIKTGPGQSIEQLSRVRKVGAVAGNGSG